MDIKFKLKAHAQIKISTISKFGSKAWAVNSYKWLLGPLASNISNWFSNLSMAWTGKEIGTTISFSPLLFLLGIKKLDTPGMASPAGPP